LNYRRELVDRPRIELGTPILQDQLRPSAQPEKIDKGEGLAIPLST
jgi:hypothetical protein